MDVLSFSDAYIKLILNDSIRKQKTHFFRDELWYLTHDTEYIGIDNEGGIKVPDVIYSEDLLFISDRFKTTLDKFGMDYLFYKKVVVSDENIGIEELFWLVSVPRIDCLDFERTIIEDKDGYDYKDGIVPFYNIEEPVIEPMNCGRYSMFRILGSTSDTVYLKEELYEKLKNEAFIGLNFRKIS